VEASSLKPLGKEDQERLEAHLRLVQSLGGEVSRLPAGNVAEAILGYAGKSSVTRILLGKPTHSRLRDWWGGSLLEQIVRGSGDLDVSVIAGDDDGAPPRARSPAVRSPVVWLHYLWGLALVAGTTLIASGLRWSLGLPDVEMLYLACIMVAAALLGRGPSLVAAVFSVAAFDFFFVPPRFTFAFADARYGLTFAMMLGVGVFIGSLTQRIRRQEQDARLREERTSALYAVSRELGSAIDREQIAQVAARHAAAVLASRVAVYLPDDQGVLAPHAAVGREARPEDAPDSNAAGVARWVFEHGRLAGLGTDTLPGAQVFCVPLGSVAVSYGVLALAPRTQEPLTGDRREFALALARQVTVALERSRLAEEAKAAVLKARTEELRSSLLSAVSHDLRTPLAAITGAATSLRDDPGLPAPVRADLLEAICEEAERLERLVGNLLDMTRVESGGLNVEREWVPLEEVVGAALTRLEKTLAGRSITTDLTPTLPLVSVDPVLLEQVFINLLENAAKYTPAATPLEIRAFPSPGGIDVEVLDRGPGFPPGEELRIFEKFHRGAHVGVGGVGLGLSICKGILGAHGGSLLAENRPGGGARFLMHLPIVGEAPPLTSEPQTAAVEVPR
jgi:two-component system sensor histidine kinase KdpD